ncbi:MAG: cation:proton antiporter [Dysgonamonadaceae bacterium]|jgi:CPA2 family monovalent cation:H+ antiporter-2|nr:cation:proton antiporter [Dysgonamonadaceae bacterium]
MSHLPTFMTDLAFILIVAGVITLIFKWLKQPLVLGYIVAGLLAGPYIHLFPTVVDMESVTTWAEIGVVFLLFALGLEFSFKKLMNVGSTAFITALTEVFSMLLVGYCVGQWLGWSSMDSIFLGGMLSMSSTTIIIKAFDDLGLRSRKFTGIVFGTLVVEDLVAILMMVLLSTMAVTKEFAGEAMLGSILKVSFFLVLWFVIGIFLLPAFFKKMRKFMNDETLLIVSLGLCLGMVVMATKTGFSAALGAFIMGSILAETVEAEHIEHLIKPVKDLFGAIFFVSVGMLVDPAILVEYALPVVAITVTTIVGKAIFSSLGVLLSGQPLKISVQSGFSLAQIGEFAFIIASLGVSLGVMAKFVYPIIVAVSVITTFTTPYFIRLSNPFANWLYQALPERTIAFLEKYASGAKTINHESDWKKLLKSYFSRLLIYVVLLTAIILLSFHVIHPFILSEFSDWGNWGKLLGAALTLLLMSPFLIALISNRTNTPQLFMNLWKDSKYNRGRLVSLVLLRVSIAIFFVVFVLIKGFDFRYLTGIIVSVAFLSLIVIFRRDLNRYTRLEKRFLSNLNQREEAERKRHPLRSSFVNDLSGRDIHLATITVSPDAPMIGQTLHEMELRKKYGISVVKIIRGDRIINIPDGRERLYPQDKVMLVGTDERLQQIQQEMETVHAENENLAPNTVDLRSFTIEKDSFLTGKTIRESGVGQQYNCVIVGIEREDTSMMNPDSAIVLEPGDLIWVVGEVENIQRLVGSWELRTKN